MLLSIFRALLCLLVPLSAAALSERDLLPDAQAFALSARTTASDRLELSWAIAPGYYLYRERIKVESATPSVSVRSSSLPPGTAKEDPFFGKVHTFRGRLIAVAEIKRTDPNVRELKLNVTHQGCADAGICYPPQRTQLHLNLPLMALAASATQPATSAPVTGAPAPAIPVSASSSGLNARPKVPAQISTLPEIIDFNKRIGADPNEVLSIEQAFPFDAIAGGPGEILARFTMPKGYYLYRDKLSFNVLEPAGARLVASDLKAGEQHVDEHFGAVEIYRDELAFTLKLSGGSKDARNVRFSASFQGCKENGICYPPETVTREVKLSAPAPVVVAPAPISEPQSIAAKLAQSGKWLQILALFGIGILLAFTPCVFPTLPILTSIIAGEKNLTPRRALMLSLAYVLAMASVYALAGVIAGLTGANLQAAFQNPWIVSSFVLILLGLALSKFGLFHVQLASGLQSWLHRVSLRFSGGTLVGAAIMGALSALIVGPCVAPPLAGVLIYLSQSGDALLAGLALFALGLGMGLPLVILGVTEGRFLPQAGPWMDQIKHGFGVGLLALAIWMLDRIVPAPVTMALFGGLSLIVGVYLGALDRLPIGSTGWRNLQKGLGLVLLVLGTLQMIGAASGGRYWLQPLAHLKGGSAGAQGVQFGFTAVDSNAALDAALAQGQPVMLDFYADWCVDCKRMERTTFADPQVAQALSGYLLLKADVTANNAEHKALMKRFSIIGPPAILFFDASGAEIQEKRLSGYVASAAFIQHLKTGAL